MKLANTFASLAILLTSATAQFSTSYNPNYDNPQLSMSAVACSDGPHGLMKRFPTVGSLPGYPYVGAAPAVTGWNSPNCGTCWNITYTDEGVMRTISLLAVDASTNYTTTTAAMNNLTNGQAIFLGRVDVTVVQVPSSVCGL